MITKENLDRFIAAYFAAKIAKENMKEAWFELGMSLDDPPCIARYNRATYSVKVRDVIGGPLVSRVIDLTE